MRIVNSVLGDASGGRWQVVCDYSRLLSAQGHRVLMLVGRRHLPDATRLPPGVKLEVIDNRGHYDLVAAWRLRRRLLGFDPQLAVAHCSRSVALLKRALGGRAPLLAVSHSHKIRRLLPADACVALNQSIRARFASAANGKPCFVIPNGIQIDACQAPGQRQPSRPPRIAALGRFDSVKGFDVFIDALALLKESGRQFQAVLGGAGAERHALHSLAVARGLAGELTFPGWVEDVDRFYAETDILCIPARSDAFGLTPLQAARAGTPMVLSNAEGHRDMFEPGREALYADVGDSRQTADQLARLMDDPGLCEDLRQAAFHKVLDRYSEAVIAERLSYAIDKIVKNTDI
ncbi:MAG: glycosyltransferase family 4 protein [Thiogranum sp.]|jgi:glycosyltransferase involved in cell wall biosynthesis